MASGNHERETFCYFLDFNLTGLPLLSGHGFNALSAESIDRNPLSLTSICFGLRFQYLSPEIFGC